VWGYKVQSHTSFLLVGLGEPPDLHGVGRLSALWYDWWRIATIGVDDMAKAPEKNPLVTVLDEMFLELKAFANPAQVVSKATEGWPDETPTAENEPDPISFGDRLRLFEAGLKWCSVRDKVAETDESDPFGALRERYTRSTRRSNAGATTPKAGAAPNGAGSPGAKTD
jgi:hypothetical protein